MLKLKIGTNFLLLENYMQHETTDDFICFMMGNFNGNNLLATPVFTSPHEVIKTMEEHHTNTIYVLTLLDIISFKKKGKQRYRAYIRDYKYELISYTHKLKTAKPDIDIKVINVNAYLKTNEFQISQDIFRALALDKNSIVSVLGQLNTYKNITKRYNSIPQELKVIDNDIKRLEKTTQVCDRIATLDSLQYLKLIKEATLSGAYLDLTLHKLPIYPSEELGKVFTKQNFLDNPYLFKAATYIYQGCHFEMPETQIQIDTGFRPSFIATLDKRFDRMFRYHNWSTVGYPHFGIGHFCPGEFNDTMAHGREYGLDYYFIALKQYLTTANMRDTAGARVWWYPIYNDEGELVYCAGMDILLNEYIQRIEPQVYNRIKDLTWDEKVAVLKDYEFDHRGISTYGYSNLSYYGPNRTEDHFLNILKDRDPELYDKIMKGRAING